MAISYAWRICGRKNDVLLDLSMMVVLAIAAVSVGHMTVGLN